jgi:hypothetical protein
MFVLLGLMLAIGAEKKLETWLITNVFDVTQYEQILLKQIN